MGRTLKSESPRRRRRQTKQGGVLSEELIVEAALRVLRHHGATGLTVRRLGTALGADPTALYRYFRGIEDVVLAITDELLRRVVEGWEPTGRWREDMRELGVRVHRVYVEHPQAGVLAASRVTGGPTRSRSSKRFWVCCGRPDFPSTKPSTCITPSSTRCSGSPRLMPPSKRCPPNIEPTTTTRGAIRTRGYPPRHTPTLPPPAGCSTSRCGAVGLNRPSISCSTALPRD